MRCRACLNVCTISPRLKDSSLSQHSQFCVPLQTTTVRLSLLSPLSLLLWRIRFASLGGATPAMFNCVGCHQAGGPCMGASMGAVLHEGFNIWEPLKEICEGCIGPEMH